MIAKAELRQRMRTVLERISPQEAECQAMLAAERLPEWSLYRNAQNVLLYAALPGELDTGPMLHRVLADGKGLLLPRCEEGEAMQAVRVEDLRSLAPGRFGIREPSHLLPAADPQSIDLVLAPGLAFDRAGARLGRGRGFFDRFLLHFHGIVAGVAYLEQILPQLPAEIQDVRMAYLVTARGVLPTHWVYKGEGSGLYE